MAKTYVYQLPENVWEAVRKLKPSSDALVLLQIYLRLGQNDSSWESNENIGKALNMHPIAVSRAISRLKSQNILQTKKSDKSRSNDKLVNPVDEWRILCKEKKQEPLAKVLSGVSNSVNPPLAKVLSEGKQNCYLGVSKSVNQIRSRIDPRIKSSNKEFPFGEQTATATDVAPRSDDARSSEVKIPEILFDDFSSNQKFEVEKPKKLRKKKSEVVPQKDDATKNVSKPANDTFRLLEYYDEGFRKTYNSEPLKHAREDFGIAKNILERCAKDFSKACQLIDHFFSRKNAYYVQRGHSLRVLIGDLHKIHSEMSSGRIITSRTAKDLERFEHNDIVIKQTAEMREAGVNPYLAILQQMNIIDKPQNDAYLTESKSELSAKPALPELKTLPKGIESGDKEKTALELERKRCAEAAAEMNRRLGWTPAKEN